MKRKDIVAFILNKAKENKGHIGLPQRVYFVDFYLLDGSSKMVFIENVNIYHTGQINVRYNRNISYVSDSMCTNSKPCLVAIYNEIVNDRYL